MLLKFPSVSVSKHRRLRRGRCLSGGAELAVPLEGLIDFEQERRRLQREQEKLQAEAAKLEAQLGNPNFVSRAPAERVNEVRERIAAIAQQSSQLQQTVENLQ